MRAPFQILVIPFRSTAAGPEFAVLKRRDAEYWQFVAGGGEDDESPGQAAERETKEEIGIAAHGRLIQMDSVATVPRTCFGLGPFRTRGGNRGVEAGPCARPTSRAPDPYGGGRLPPLRPAPTGCRVPEKGHAQCFPKIPDFLCIFSGGKVVNTCRGRGV